MTSEVFIPLVARPLALLGGLLPVAVIFAFLYVRFREAVSFELIGLALGFGAILTIPVAAIELALFEWVSESSWPAVAQNFLTAFAIAGLVEETSKFLVITLFLLRHEDVRNPADIVLLAAATSVGFAGLENIFYVFDNPGYWGEVALGRAVTATPSHAVGGVAMGSLLALYRFGGLRKRHLLLALVIPVALHGAYNYPLLVQDFMPSMTASSWIIFLFNTVLLAEITTTAIIVRWMQLRTPPAKTKQSKRSPRTWLSHLLFAPLVWWILGATLVACGSWLWITAAVESSNSNDQVPAALALAATGFYPLFLGTLFLLHARQGGDQSHR